MNLMISTLKGLELIEKAMEPCEFCGKRESVIQCHECGQQIKHHKGAISIDHFCAYCNGCYGKGE